MVIRVIAFVVPGRSREGGKSRRRELASIEDTCHLREPEPIVSKPLPEAKAGLTTPPDRTIIIL